MNGKYEDLLYSFASIFSFYYLCKINILRMMKNFFEGIAYLFEEFLFVPFNILRKLELDNWWLANIVTWLFLFIGICAASYWINQLRVFNKKGEENKDPSAHSFL